MSFTRITLDVRTNVFKVVCACVQQGAEALLG